MMAPAGNAITDQSDREPSGWLRELLRGPARRWQQAAYAAPEAPYLPGTPNNWAVDPLTFLEDWAS
ncbi:MAG TPA: hypothetical protein VL051_14185 [Burkholderiaceae bacterium]|nr:hypothetical protein [Burkholderiaceae bacterium]